MKKTSSSRRRVMDRFLKKLFGNLEESKLFGNVASMGV